jgi:branched-chain amino acid transport system permease protein
MAAIFRCTGVTKVESVIAVQILNAITFGLIFAMIAVGLSLVMGLMEVVNFAHGCLYMLGAYVTATVLATCGNFWVGLLVSAPACAFMGATLYFGVVRPMVGRPPLESMVALVGISVIFQRLTINVWGSDPKVLPIPFGSLDLKIAGIDCTYPVYFVIVACTASIVLLSLYVLYRKTNLGIRCVAAIQDRETAKCMGVNVDKIGSLTFLVGSAVAGLAGGLAGPIFSVYPTMANEMIAIMFTVVIVGGLGSISGTILASVAIAMIKCISMIFVSGNICDILAFSALLVILLVRPRGIMGLAAVME